MKVIYNDGHVAECAPEEELHILRHSAAHILAQAVKNLYPQAHFAYGPATETGFYYDIDLGDVKLNEDDLPAIEKEMQAIVKKNLAALQIPSEQFRICNYDYAVCLDCMQGQFDLILIDPPYQMPYGVTALEKIAKRGLLSENGVAVYERDRAFEGEIDGLEKYDERKYGKAYLTFFRRLKKD